MKARHKQLLAILSLLLVLMIAFWKPISIQWHCAAMRRADHMLWAFNSGSGSPTVADRCRGVLYLALGLRSSSDWADHYNEHKNTLLKQGYLVQADIPFHNPQLPKLLALHLGKTQDSLVSLRYPSNGKLILTAPETDITKWKDVVAKLDELNAD